MTMDAVTVLAEASSPFARMARLWGFSALIGDTLYDTFSDERTLRVNCGRYGVRPGAIRRVVISHDHWDHVGGLPWVLGQNPDADVYIGVHADDTLRRLVRSEHMIDVSLPKEIDADMFLLGEMPGKHNGRNVFEIPLIAGETLVTGCAHPGIVRIVEHAKRLGKTVTRILGGLHLMEAGTVEVDDLIRRLKSLGITHVAPCHCTGRHAVRRFRKAFGKNCSVIRRHGIYNTKEQL